MPADPIARLVLETGRVFRGTGFGAPGTASGEVVFNTSLTGYQEILTDPSYRGQMVAMTNPHIGNTGVNDEDPESRRIWAAALIVRERSAIVSSWRAKGDLDGYLKRWGVVGIEGIDTRALTRELRERGALRGVVATDGATDDELRARARAVPELAGRDLVREVTCEAPYPWREGSGDWLDGAPRAASRPLHVVAYDLGIKTNILRRLADLGVRVSVVPAGTTAEDVLHLEPSGVFLSNGPGDPAALGPVAGEVKKLLGKRPVFGICLGHQLLGLALGGRTFKMKFGHHGGNHPVRDVRTGKVEITVQNHGFAVDPDSLPAGVEPTHWNLNDGALEGFRHAGLDVLAVQYHPEAAPGPHDSHYLFGEFLAAMERREG